MYFAVELRQNTWKCTPWVTRFSFDCKVVACLFAGWLVLQLHFALLRVVFYLSILLAFITNFSKLSAPLRTFPAL